MDWEKVEELNKILEEPDISGLDWELGKSILANWKAGLAERVCGVFEPHDEPMEAELDWRKEPGESRLLMDEELIQAEHDYIYRTYQQVKVTLGFPLIGYRRDECIKQAQDAKTASMLKVKLPENPYIEASRWRSRHVWDECCQATKELNPEVRWE